MPRMKNDSYVHLIASFALICTRQDIPDDLLKTAWDDVRFKPANQTVVGSSPPRSHLWDFLSQFLSITATSPKTWGELKGHVTYTSTTFDDKKVLSADFCRHLHLHSFVCFHSDYPRNMGTPYQKKSKFWTKFFLHPPETWKNTKVGTKKKFAQQKFARAHSQIL
jgi:hypothetical protein